MHISLQADIFLGISEDKHILYLTKMVGLWPSTQISKKETAILPSSWPSNMQSYVNEIDLTKKFNHKLWASFASLSIQSISISVGEGNEPLLLHHFRCRSNKILQDSLAKHLPMLVSGVQPTGVGGLKTLHQPCWSWSCYLERSKGPFPSRLGVYSPLACPCGLSHSHLCPRSAMGVYNDSNCQLVKSPSTREGNALQAACFSDSCENIARNS